MGVVGFDVEVKVETFNVNRVSLQYVELRASDMAEKEPPGSIGPYRAQGPRRNSRAARQESSRRQRGTRDGDLLAQLVYYLDDGERPKPKANQ